jgi:hypothetical protein
MKPLLHLVRRCTWCAAALVTMLFTARAQAGSACPNWVETSSGSSFNVAAVIADNGSPQAALVKVRAALSQMDAVGGCKALGDSVACHETVALAAKAIAALEECTSVPNSNKQAEKAGVE